MDTSAGRGRLVTGWQNKLLLAITNVAPGGGLAEMHRGVAEPQQERG